MLCKQSGWDPLDESTTEVWWDINVMEVAAMKTELFSPVDAAIAPTSTGGIPNMGMRIAAA